MKQALLLLLVLACAPELFASVPCEPQPRTVEGLKRTEEAWLQALLSKDREKVGCVLAPEFIDSNVKGKLRPRATVISELPNRPDFKQTLVIEGAFIEGSTGIVYGRNVISTPEGKEIAQVRFTDTLMHDGHSWKALAAQETMVDEHSGSNGSAHRESQSDFP
jgi:hypothetical protein